MSDSQVQISLNDISNILSIIDIVSSRGAFKGQELTSVGYIRDKLALFVEQNKPIKDLNTIEKTNE